MIKNTADLAYAMIDFSRQTLKVPPMAGKAPPARDHASEPMPGQVMTIEAYKARFGAATEIKG